MSISAEDIAKAADLDNGEFTSVSHPHLNVWLQSNDGRARISIGYTGTLPVRLESCRGYRVVHDVKQERIMNYVVFEETDRTLRQAFTAMVVAAWNRSSSANAPDTSLVSFLTTIVNLRELFSSRRKQFSEDELRGIAAELLTIRLFISAGASPSTAIEGWKAPLGSTRDFVFSATHSVEVKSTRPDSGTITISSIAQLDDDGNELQLVVWPLVKADADAETSTSLSDLVAELRSLCDSDEAAALAFAEALDEIGLTGNADDIASAAYSVGDHHVFDVGDAFPRLRTVDVPSEIRGVTYTLRTPDLTDHLGTLSVP